MGLDVNFHALENTLNNMDKKIASEKMDKVLDAGARVMINNMKMTVPKKTLKLHNSLGELKHLRRGKGLKRSVTVGIATEDRKIIEYGYYNNHGTRYIAGSAWMKRAFINGNDDAKKAMIQALKGLI